MLVELNDEQRDTIEVALYFLRASDRTEMHGNQLERIDAALAALARAQGQQWTDGWYRLTGGDEAEVYVAMCRNGYMTDFGFAYMLPESGWIIEPVVIVTKADYDRQAQRIAELEQAARALYAALDEREHCKVCGGVGTIIGRDDLILPCSCRITAGRALDNWEEWAKGEGTDE